MMVTVLATTIAAGSRRAGRGAACRAVLGLCALRPLGTGLAVAVAAAGALAAAQGEVPGEAAVPAVFQQDVAWSPDGARLAFSELPTDREYRPENWSVYVVDADGGGRRLVAANAFRVSWSPDGKRLAFGSARSGDWEIYVAPVDGGDGALPERLTEHPASDRAAAWSPRGDRIAFTSDRDGNAEIYVMGADGSEPRRLTRNPAADHDPFWSPDGRELVFYRTVGKGVDQIFVVDVETAEERAVTRDGNLNTFPSFRPDGRIAFSTKEARNGAERIVHVKPDGTERAELDLQGAFFARWSPDGASVAFIRGDWPVSAIYRARADGTGEARVVP